MRIAVTGASGFLGWHVRCLAFARGVQAVPVPRDILTDPVRLAVALDGVDAVVHCAGVNRGADTDVTEGNLRPARCLAEAVRRTERPIRIVYANSTRAGEDTAYGLAKRKAADILAGATPAPALSDVALPNLYGEHGRPRYNSFVATFCHEIAAGREPADVRDREISLLHAQDAAKTLLHEAAESGHREVTPAAEPTSVRRVLRLLNGFASAYRGGELPDLADRFATRLFNTYRSHLFPSGSPMHPEPRTDRRGTLLECVRAGSGGQAFVSSTAAGEVRGEHVHLRKFERFMVVSGEAEIALRRLHTGRVVRFRVSGERPAVVDIPTMWAHNLTAFGGVVTAFFWTNETYDPADPDTYPVAVDPSRSAA